MNAMLVKYAAPVDEVVTSQTASPTSSIVARTGMTYEPIARRGRASVSVWALVATGKREGDERRGRTNPPPASGP